MRDYRNTLEVGHRVAVLSGDKQFASYGIVTHCGSVLCDVLFDGWLDPGSHPFFYVIPVPNLEDRYGLTHVNSVSETTRSVPEMFSSADDVDVGKYALTGLYRYINETVFDGVLPNIPVRKGDISSLGRFKAEYGSDGKVIDGTARIYVSSALTKPKDLKMVLVHEMCHAYQAFILGNKVDGDKSHYNKNSVFDIFTPVVRERLGVELRRSGI